MSKWLCLALLAVAAHSAQAAQTAAAEDDMARFMADRGLLGQIERARINVVGRASDLVVTAMAFLDRPYKRGGNDADSGFDCSGFVRSIYERTVGYVLPRLAKDQAAATQPIDEKELQPGDLVFFNTSQQDFSHVGIYVGDGKFIHSPKPGAQVRVEDMRQAYWSRRFDGARRVVNFEPPAAAQQ